MSMDAYTLHLLGLAVEHTEGIEVYKPEPVQATWLVQTYAPNAEAVFPTLAEALTALRWALAFAEGTTQTPEQIMSQWRRWLDLARMDADDRAVIYREHTDRFRPWSR
jgi:hypothetical protein